MPLQATTPSTARAWAWRSSRRFWPGWTTPSVATSTVRTTSRRRETGVSFPCQTRFTLCMRRGSGCVTGMHHHSWQVHRFCWDTSWLPRPSWLAIAPPAAELHPCSLLLPPHQGHPVLFLEQGRFGRHSLLQPPPRPLPRRVQDQPHHLAQPQRPGHREGEGGCGCLSAACRGWLRWALNPDPLALPVHLSY